MRSMSRSLGSGISILRSPWATFGSLGFSESDFGSGSSILPITVGSRESRSALSFSFPDCRRPISASSAQRSSGTASCAERLAAAGVARVVFAAPNPDARSAGQGPDRLRAAGVTVEGGFLADEAAVLYAGFLHRLQRGRARVEAAEGPRTYDGAFDPLPDEDLAATLTRLGGAGMGRVWTPLGGPLAARLREAGLLSENLAEVLR